MKYSLFLYDFLFRIMWLCMHKEGKLHYNDHSDGVPVGTESQLGVFLNTFEDGRLLFYSRLVTRGPQ